MIFFIQKTAVASAMLVVALSASAAIVSPGSQLGVQITGAYATADAAPIRAGSVINILPISFFGMTFAPYVTSVATSGTVDLQGLSAFDLTDGFVGDFFTVGLSAPSVDFSILTGDEDASFTATSTEPTASTSIPVAFGDSLLLEGFGVFDGALASWGLSISGDGPTGQFTFSMSVPPIIEVEPIPLPAGAPLLIGALGALAFARRKAA